MDETVKIKNWDQTTFNNAVTKIGAACMGLGEGFGVGGVDKNTRSKIITPASVDAEVYARDMLNNEWISKSESIRSITFEDLLWLKGSTSYTYKVEDMNDFVIADFMDTLTKSSPTYEQINVYFNFNDLVENMAEMVYISMDGTWNFKSKYMNKTTYDKLIKLKATQVHYTGRGFGTASIIFRIESLEV